MALLKYHVFDQLEDWGIQSVALHLLTPRYSGKFNIDPVIKHLYPFFPSGGSG